MTSEYISTKDTAKLVRVAIRNAFPGVRFSVRMSTGTASAWMNVTWEDGPTDAAVMAVTARYEGRRFNGMTDSYDDVGSALVAFVGEELPREVSYMCDGILTHRHYTTVAYSAAQHLITADSDHKDLILFTPDGDPIAGAALPESIYVNAHIHDNVYSAVNVAQMILRHVDLPPVPPGSRTAIASTAPTSKDEPTPGARVPAEAGAYVVPVDPMDDLQCDGCQ